MKLWFSIYIQKPISHYEGASIHFEEPHWCDDKTFVDGGYWISGKVERPCISWVRRLLQDLELPTRPRELLEIEVTSKGLWEWR